MLGRSLTILTIAAALAIAVALKLRGDGHHLADGILWGVAGGFLAALSAVGGAIWAVARNLAMNQALAIVVVGMLVRMAFLAALTVAAVKLGGVDPVGFVLGFAGIYIVGQALEVRLLTRLKARRTS